MRRRYTQWPSLLLARHYYDKHASPSSSTCAFLLFKKKFDFHFWNRKKIVCRKTPPYNFFFSKLVCILADCWFACSLEEKKNNCRRVIMIISVGGPKVETPPFSLCTFRSVFSSVYIRLSELSARKWWDGQTVTLVERERRGLVGFLSFFFLFFSYRHLRRTQTKLPIFQLFELRAAATTTTPPRTRSLLLLPTGSALFSASRPALPRRPNYTDITIRADRYLMTWPIQVKEKKKKKKKIHSAVAVIFFPGVFSEGALRRPKLTPFGLHNCLW